MYQHFQQGLVADAFALGYKACPGKIGLRTAEGDLSAALSGNSDVVHDPMLPARTT